MTAASSANIKCFESVPGNYRRGAKLRGHQIRRHRAVLRLLSGLTGNVLDYGCGYGDITDLISNQHAVTGCDVDPRRIAFAASEYPSIQFSRCDPLGTSFDDHSFDVVVSSVVIHFVPDASRYLDEVRRLLRPEGTLVLLCQNQPILRNAARQVLGKPKAPTCLWVPTMNEMRAMLVASGFEIFRSTYFYDPPVESWRTAQDWLFGSIQQLLSASHLGSTADYYGYCARKAAKSSPQVTVPHFDSAARGSTPARFQTTPEH